MLYLFLLDQLLDRCRQILFQKLCHVLFVIQDLLKDLDALLIVQRLRGNDQGIVSRFVFTAQPYSVNVSP